MLRAGRIAIAAGLVLVAAQAAAQPSTTVKSLVGDGYAIVGSFPIEGGYGIVLQKGGDVMLCSIEFDGAGAFATTKCYPVD